MGVGGQGWQPPGRMGTGASLSKRGTKFYLTRRFLLEGMEASSGCSLTRVGISIARLFDTIGIDNFDITASKSSILLASRISIYRYRNLSINR